MNKLKFLVMIIVILFAGNMILLAVYVQHKKESFNPNKPKNIIIERLDFDDHQITAYSMLVDEHRKVIRSKNSEILQCKKVLYLHLTQIDQEKICDSLTSTIAKLQKEIETIHFEHFLDIKNLCNQNQLEKYELLVGDLVEIKDRNKHPQK